MTARGKRFADYSIPSWRFKSSCVTVSPLPACSRARAMEAMNSGSRSRAYQYISSSSKSVNNATAWPFRISTTSSFFASCRTSSNLASACMSIIFMLGLLERFRSSLFEDAQDSYLAIVLVYVIIHAEIIYPQPVLAPKRFGHSFDAGPANLRRFVAQVEFDPVQNLPLVKESQALQFV